MSEDKKYKIEHDRESCIGCSACASVCPDYWSMDSDGKSSIKDGVESNGVQRLGSNEEPVIDDFESNMDAAESCPVNCIHIYEIEGGSNDKKLI